MKLPDVQQTKTGFKKLPIEKVGIRNIKVPFNIITKNNNVSFNTIATISSYCNLVENIKGINMSRISRTINNVLKEKNTGLKNLNNFVYALQKAHETNDIYIKAEFDYIYKTLTPLTNIESYEPIQVEFESILRGGKLNNYITIKTTEMSLCPCSKEMSLLINNLSNEEKQWLKQQNIPETFKFKLQNAGFGAHNQKSIVKITVEVPVDPEKEIPIWIEDIVDIIRNSVSSPTWSTLKRPDEKWVTETSYMGGYFDEQLNFIKTTGGPMFVEDIARNIANELNQILDKDILDYVIIVNNQESIHSDDIMATAVLSAGRNLK